MPVRKVLTLLVGNELWFGWLQYIHNTDRSAGFLWSLIASSKHLPVSINAIEATRTTGYVGDPKIVSSNCQLQKAESLSSLKRDFVKQSDFHRENSFRVVQIMSRRSDTCSYINLGTSMHCFLSVRRNRSDMSQFELLLTLVWLEVIPFAPIFLPHMQYLSCQDRAF